MNDYWKELKLDVLLAPDKGKSEVEHQEDKETIDEVDKKSAIKSECKFKVLQTFIHFR